MASKKEISIIGYVGKDAEMKETKNSNLATFSVGVTETFGEKKTYWFGCNVWGKNAENAYKLIKRGKLIGVDGNFQQDEYNDKTYLKINVRAFHLLEKQERSSQDSFSKTGLSKDNQNYDLPF